MRKTLKNVPIRHISLNCTKTVRRSDTTPHTEYSAVHWASEGGDRIFLCWRVNLKKNIFHTGGHPKKWHWIAVKPGLCRGYWAEPIVTKTVRCAPTSRVTACKPHPTTWIAEFFIDFCMKPKKCEKNVKNVPIRHVSFNCTERIQASNMAQPSENSTVYWASNGEDRSLPCERVNFRKNIFPNWGAAKVNILR